MSRAAVIARLEALLERVRTRAATGQGLLQSVPPPANAAPAAAAASAAAAPVATPPARSSSAASEPEIDFVVQETVIDLSEPFDDAPPARAAEGRSPATAAPTSPPLAGADDLDDDLAGPPSSSRRIIAAEPEQQLSEMTFGASDLPPPRHTPPPESGRLPAAPDADLEPEILLDASEVDITSVRPAGPTTPVPGAGLPGPNEAPTPLAPHVTRGAIPAGPAVPSLLGKAQEFAPETFLELLDASLDL
jgi:hypothetical protein